MLEKIFNKVVSFDNYEIVEYSPGNIILKIIVQKDSLNPYGNAHGGFLYTICDSLAGACAYSLNSAVVTQQASINYLKTSTFNDELIFKTNCLHNGKSTKVIQIDIFKSDTLIAQATFTMYVLKNI